MYKSKVNDRVRQTLENYDRKNIKAEKYEDFYPDLVNEVASAREPIKLGLGRKGRKNKQMDYMDEDEFIQMEGGAIPIGAIASIVAPALIPIVWDVVKAGTSYLTSKKEKKEEKQGSGFDTERYMTKMVRDAEELDGGVALYRDNRRKGGAYKLTPKDNLQATSFGGGKVGEKPKKQLNDKMRKRNELIKKLMREKGMSLPEASRHIKDKGLL